MNIAYVTESGRGLIDDCLSETVAVLQDHGFRLAGTVRARPPGCLDHPCVMEVRVLPDGPLHRISQPLGAGSRGCRLNGGAIETLAVKVEERMPGADLLVVNKFGKQENLGRGLRPAIVKALELGVPVLVGVNGLNLPGLVAFTAGQAIQLRPDPRAMVAWAYDVLSPQAMASTCGACFVSAENVRPNFLIPRWLSPADDRLIFRNRGA
jgi:hypothetical protein